MAAGLVACGVSCTSDEWPPASLEDDDDDEGGSSTGDDDALYDVAQLEIFAPEAASIHAIGSSIFLWAQLRHPDGVLLSVDDIDIAWVAEGIEPTLLDTLEGDIQLPPGVYDLSVVAHLPNGDRLQTTVGDIRVQAPWTGLYSGNVALVIAIEFQGFPVAPRCDGPLEILVGLDGQNFEAESGECTLDVFITTFDASYSIEAEIDDAGIVTGTINFVFQAPTGPFEIPIEWTGAFTDGAFGAGLAGSVSIPLFGTAEVSGSLQAALVDATIDPEED